MITITCYNLAKLLVYSAAIDRYFRMEKLPLLVTSRDHRPSHTVAQAQTEMGLGTRLKCSFHQLLKLCPSALLTAAIC